MHNLLSFFRSSRPLSSPGSDLEESVTDEQAPFLPLPASYQNVQQSPETSKWRPWRILLVLFLFTSSLGLALFLSVQLGAISMHPRPVLYSPTSSALDTIVTSDPVTVVDDAHWTRRMDWFEPDHYSDLQHDLASRIAEKTKCQTYAERYAPYDAEDYAPPARVRRSDQAVIYRTYSGRTWTDEYIRSFRALETEATRAGFDLYIVSEDPSGEMHNIPEEFKPITVTFDFDVITQPYSFPPSQSPPKVAYNHIASTWFHSNHAFYNHVWTIEADVRFLGDWDVLFNRVALQAEGKHYDFVRFGMKPWRDGAGHCGEIWPSRAVSGRTHVQMWRGSSAFFAEILEYMSKNQSCYIEFFLPAVAEESQQRLSSLRVTLPIYDLDFGQPLPGLWDAHSNLSWGVARFPVAGYFYNEWKDHPSLCRFPTLVHRYRETGEGSTYCDFGDEECQKHA